MAAHTGKNVLIINGSIHGNKRNTGLLIRYIQKSHPNVRFDVVELQRGPKAPSIIKKLNVADAVLFLTGTYWDSWGSPLQKFLEDFTDYELDKSFFGKPAGVITLMHSVGGKSVLSRLQGVLSSMGFLLPPLTGMAYSLAGALAQKTKSIHADDFWIKEDTETIIENLLLATDKKTEWKKWPIDRKNFKKKWIK